MSARTTTTDPADLLALDPVSSTSPLERRRREIEIQRNLMDVHRDTLRAAERTISLLREQIRLHDERARLSIASLVPSPAPFGTPARTPTQRAALERSLSSRIASLQADIEQQQLRASAVGLIRRPETEALLEQRNILSARRSSPPAPPPVNPSAACPITPFSTGSSPTPDRVDPIRSSSWIPFRPQRRHMLPSATSSRPALAESSPTPNRIDTIRSSSDRLIAARQERDIILSSASSARRSLADFRDHYRQHLRLPSGSSFSTAQDALEREWERQLADGEVDSNGVPIIPDRKKLSPIELPHSLRSSYHSSTHLGRRKVEGLGIQLAHVASSSASFKTNPDHDPSQSGTLLDLQPLCLR
ncbi:hypothetical protein PCANC_23355 [Puccinia coronata f. sp. avenae]|uniref:Uncharacterized protein n=1 Tax=Puccinia coronata f. sp. avenae TaxID=200324 RepID=A0A2N5TXT7_9BASI|nr:hypothetical protein PCANC_23355 [Puccinia coronata f. sp. avenae]